MPRKLVKGLFWCHAEGEPKTGRLESDDLGPQCPDCMSGRITPEPVPVEQGKG